MKKIELLENIRTAEEFKANKINYYFFRAYERSKEANFEKINFEDTGFERDIEEIVENLKRFEIKEITISDQSTALMKSLIGFNKMGLQITDLNEEKQAIELTRF